MQFYSIFFPWYQKGNIFHLSDGNCLFDDQQTKENEMTLNAREWLFWAGKKEVLS